MGFIPDTERKDGRTAQNETRKQELVTPGGGAESERSRYASLLRPDRRK